MAILSYKVRFLTPGFLGDAKQDGRWRTPPFKALLRQWWRVVWAADHGFSGSVEAMRYEEGRLFGNAWLKSGEGANAKTCFNKSLVRLRLDRWDEGRETKASWGKKELNPAEKILHPERGQQIGPMLYLGYGPLTTEKTTVPGQSYSVYPTLLKGNAAIQAGECAELSLAVLEDHPNPELAEVLKTNRPRLQRALWLMDRYGTVGGRSRNGWGSFVLEPVGANSQLVGATPLLDWDKALEQDWPHCIGKDGKGPLIWRTVGSYEDWKQLMRDMAIVKLGLRTQFVFTPGSKGKPEDRHWLSYPVTNHKVDAWGEKLRLPNSLRFKVRPAPGDSKKLVGVIFHVPCQPPPRFGPNEGDLKRVWRQVHELLDELCRDAKGGGRQYMCIKDAARRVKLKPMLDSVQLVRVKE
jgi:CRISPR-associated protein Cmr1